MKANFSDVMAELRGRRLAVYDDLLRGVAIEVSDANVQNALGWLAYHQLAYRTSDGVLRARARADAQERWRLEGAAKEAGQILADGAEATVAEELAAAAPVQPHQVQFFTMGGYKL